MKEGMHEIVLYARSIACLRELVEKLHGLKDIIEALWQRSQRAHGHPDFHHQDALLAGNGGLPSATLPPRVRSDG